MSDICVTPHLADLQALPGLRLCTGCHAHLAGDLRALPRLWHDLGNNLATVSSPGQRVTTTSNHPLPINPAIVDHRDQIRHDLAFWAVFVADARGISTPANTVTDIATWLGRHVNWIAAQRAAAEECPPVIRELAARARTLLTPSGSRRIKVGPCQIIEAGEPCAGTLYATVRQEDDPRPSAIYCDVCGFEKPPSEWMRFGREYLRERRMAG